LNSGGSPVFLGLDLGTSELKALLLDAQQRIVAVARHALTVQRPQARWSEQDPAQWEAALDAVMGALQTGHGDSLRQVRAIGLSGQMHGAVLLDSHHRVLRPAILWNDGRSAAQCAELTQAVPRLAEISGNLAMPGFTAPKLLWLRQHEPALFGRLAMVLLPKDWLRWRMTGACVTDMSDASGTLWLDVAARDWSDTLLRACGLTRAQMPRLVEGSAVSACLDPAWAARWGLDASVIVAGGAGDNAASAVGMGLVEPGQGFVSLGTSGVVFVATDRHAPRPERAVHAFCHALPGRWHQMAVMLSAAGALSWAVRAFGFADEAVLLAAAATLEAPQRARAPLFLPYLAGERSPHNDPHAQGVLFGLIAAHGPGEIAYAVAEGVCFGLRDGLDALVPPQGPMALVGGGARSDWWAQLLADVLGHPLVVTEGAEAGAALGAARLAWLAWSALPGQGSAPERVRQVCRMPAVRRHILPRAHEADALRERHARFQALYPLLRSAFPAH